jgi:signal transduction histidine kinase
MTKSILTVAIHYEQHVVVARQRARQIAALLGFDSQDQTRISTAVSEIARNAFRYARNGKVEFSLEGETAPQLLLISVSDQGPGITDLAHVMSGRYRSPTGMGLGILGTHRLMDQVDIRTAAGQGTHVLLKKILPARAPLIMAAQLARISQELIVKLPTGALDELQQQNQELLRALAELRERQDELMRLNQELEDTNRGVVALYAELDEKADHLRRADEMKSRFLSNMSHEFRTPLNSIRALTQLLLDGSDGELNSEQQIQVKLMRKSSDDLAALVDDLLDLAKIEAGKTEVRPIEFSVANLFSALRGMLRPLLVGDDVRLVFDEPETGLTLYTDEGKVSQILRNFISNALKFTERGEIRVSAELSEGTVTFVVADTGVGIAAADQDRIFDEFTQVPNPLQGRVKGTGLGLPLCRRLARLLGGDVTVQSEPNVGSTFTARLPMHYEVLSDAATVATGGELFLDPGLVPLLVVDDEPGEQLIYEKLLRGSRYQPISARSLREARDMLKRVRPRAVLLDILLRGEDSWQWLSEIKRDPATAEMPVLVATAVDDERKGLALGADAYFLKTLLKRETLLEKLDTLTSRKMVAVSA